MSDFVSKLNPLQVILTASAGLVVIGLECYFKASTFETFMVLIVSLVAVWFGLSFVINPKKEVATVIENVQVDVSERKVSDYFESIEL